MHRLRDYQISSRHCINYFQVNRLVAKGKGPDEFGQKLTVSEVKSNLRKKFYFFPGIHGNPPKLFNKLM